MQLGSGLFQDACPAVEDLAYFFPLPSGTGPDPFWLGADLSGGVVSLGFRPLDAPGLGGVSGSFLIQPGSGGLGGSQGSSQASGGFLPLPPSG